MRLTRARAAATAGLLAIAGTAAGLTLAAAPASAGSAGRLAAPAPVVMVNACTGHGQVRPTGYDPGCMPSSVIMTGLKWTSWSTVAFGHGTLAVNNCTPSFKCGPSMYTKYPILTVLWRAEAWPKHAGKDYFTRMTYIFTAKRPHGAAVAQTIMLPSS